MIACLDVGYRDTSALTACIVIAHWTDETSSVEATQPCAVSAPYESGRFFRRELPCLLNIVRSLLQPVHVIVIDGYVWLDERYTPGLGGHLHEVLSRTTPVVGVAKTAYRGAPALAVTRGNSRTPLFVSAAGMDVTEAARCVAMMHGRFRIPTILKRVDMLSRGVLQAAG